MTSGETVYSGNLTDEIYALLDDYIVENLEPVLVDMKAKITYRSGTLEVRTGPEGEKFSRSYQADSLQMEPENVESIIEDLSAGEDAEELQAELEQRK